MFRRGVVALVAFAALAVVILGFQSPSTAAERTVELKVPGCV